MDAIKIMIVEDNKIEKEMLQGDLEKVGFDCVSTENGLEALSYLKDNTVDLIISDQNMPEIGGLELLQQVKKRFGDIPFVMLTGEGSISSAVISIKEGANDYLQKPYNLEELLRVIDRSISYSRLSGENIQLKQDLGARYGLDLIAALKEKYINNNDLFDSLSPEQVKRISSLMEEIHVDKGSYIVKENTPPEELFLLLRGAADVVKLDAKSGRSHTLATLKPGDTIGEVSLLDNEPRSASVLATESCVLSVVKIKNLESLSKRPSTVTDTVKINLANVISSRLRHTNEVTVKSLEAGIKEEKARFAMGAVICWLLGGVCCYTFSLQIVALLSKKAAITTIVSVPILLCFTAIAFSSIKRSGYPIGEFGVTAEGWQKSVYEAVLFTIPVLGMVILAKWLWITFGADSGNVPLFGFLHAKHSVGVLIVSSIAYAAFAPVQELITRGWVQTSFQKLLISKHKVLIAILISNMLFSMTHLHLSTAAAIVVFIPGLFWGWLYARHTTLIGVCISHIIFGLFAIRVVGFPGLFQ